MTIDEPFEYLTFGATFSRTFSIWADRFDFYSAIAGMVMVPYAIFVVSLGFLFALWYIEEEEIPGFQPKHLPVVIVVFGFQFFVYTLATIVGKGAIVLGVARMYVGQRPTFMECLRESWNKKYPLISATFLIALVLSIAMVLLSIFIGLAVGIPNVLTITLAVLVGLGLVAVAAYAYIGTVLTVPSIMVEGFSGPIQSIKRSWELAAGSRCYLFCSLFCLWFMSDLVKRLLHNIFVTGDIMDTLFSLAGIVVELLPLIVFFPLHTILETVMYLNLRIGRESMNHQVLSGDLLSDSTNQARFRNDTGSSPDHQSTSMDYRHVPLMDAEDNMAPLAQSQEMA